MALSPFQNWKSHLTQGMPSFWASSNTWSMKGYKTWLHCLPLLETTLKSQPSSRALHRAGPGLSCGYIRTGSLPLPNLALFLITVVDPKNMLSKSPTHQSPSQSLFSRVSVPGNDCKNENLLKFLTEFCRTDHEGSLAINSFAKYFFIQLLCSGYFYFICSWHEWNPFHEVMLLSPPPPYLQFSSIFQNVEYCLMLRSKAELSAYVMIWDLIYCSLSLVCFQLISKDD